MIGNGKASIIRAVVMTPLRQITTRTLPPLQVRATTGTPTMIGPATRRIRRLGEHIV